MRCHAESEHMAEGENREWFSNRSLTIVGDGGLFRDPCFRTSGERTRGLKG